MPRAVSPVIGVLLLTALTLVLAGVAGVVAVEMGPGSDPPRPVELSSSANATADRIVLVHESGPPLDVRELDVRITVGGAPIRHQPPVPFFSATGFTPAPTGPFNVATDPHWTLGERASLRLAGTNDPPLVPGVRVRVELYRDDLSVASAETTAS